MKKQLLLSVLLLIFIINCSFSQINSQFKKSDELTLVKLADFDLSDYTYHNYASEIRPNLLVNQFNRNNTIQSETLWLGSQQSYKMNFYNLKITTNHMYDINGNLRRSSWSLKLK